MELIRTIIPVVILCLQVVISKRLNNNEDKILKEVLEYIKGTYSTL